MTMNNLSRTQLRFHHEIDNLTSQVPSITTATINVVCVDEHIKPQRLPKRLLEKIND